MTELQAELMPELLALYDSGERRCYVLAQRLGIDPKTVIRWLRGVGREIPRRGNVVQNFSREELAEAYRNGGSCAKAGALLGLTAQLFWTKATAAGVELRAQSGGRKARCLTSRS